MAHIVFFKCPFSIIRYLHMMSESVGNGQCSVSIFGWFVFQQY